MSLRSFRLLPLWLCIMAVPWLSCKSRESSDQTKSDQESGRKWNQSRAESEYELIQAEMQLVKIEKTYLVIDFNQKKLLLKLKGAVVWEYPMEFLDSDSDRAEDFVGRFLGNENKYIRPLIEKYLYSSTDKMSDSILAVVGKAVNVNPDLLQRELPQRFELSWHHGLILDIRTDVAGKPESKFKNTLFGVTRALELPFGESRVTIKMEPDAALTLYRVSEPGLPTLIYPALK